MQAFRSLRLRRFAVALGAPAAVCAAAYYIVNIRSGLRCWFFELTGLYCPGCGSGRAVAALLRGEWAAAFSSNVLLLPLGIPACFVLVYEYVRIVFPRLGLRAVALPRTIEIALIVLILAFWLLRNLPCFAFLAP